MINKALRKLAVGVCLLLLTLASPGRGNETVAGSAYKDMMDTGEGVPITVTPMPGSIVQPQASSLRSCLPNYSDRQFLLKIDQTNDFYYEPFPTAGDFDGDGTADIVITRLQWQTYATFGLDILLNDGSGGMVLATSAIFSGTTPSVQHPTDVIVADLNGDGRSDIFVANSGYDADPTPGFQNALALTSLDGRLVDATQNLPQQNDMSHSACAADIDGDEDIDLYVGNWYGLNMINPQILINDGSGRFTVGEGRLPPTVMLSHNGYTTCAFADVNNDDSPDLILGHTIAIENSPPVSEVLLNDGAGVFSQLPGAMPPKAYDPTDKAQDIAPVDLDGDAYLDLLVVYERQADASNYIRALINNQDGTFRDESASRLASFYLHFWPNWLACSGNPRRTLALRDMDRDGDLDLLAKSWDDAAHPGPQLFLNDGSGHFTWKPFEFGVGRDLYYTFIDLDDDGGHDILLAQCNPSDYDYVFAIRDWGCPTPTPTPTLTLTPTPTPTPTSTSTPTPTSTPTRTPTRTPTFTVSHHRVYLPMALRGWESAEPVMVSLMQGDAWVPTGTPIILTIAWTADTPELVADYLASLVLTVTLDGEPLSNVRDYWDEAEEYGDYDEDGDTDYVSRWRYPVGVLTAGEHQVESEFYLQWPITDGFDLDEDGVPDEYSGSWEYFLQITVGE